MKIANWLLSMVLPLSLTAAEPFKDGDTVVFFGDSITHGGRYHEFLTDFYRTRFPDADIRLVNSGIGGDNAKAAQVRIPEDVAEYQPTWVAFHFGMNDVGRSAYSSAPPASALEIAEQCQVDYRRNLPELIGKVRKAAPSAKFIYLTPTPYDDSAVVTNIPPKATGWATHNNSGCSVGLALMSGYVMSQAKKDGSMCVDWFTPLQSFLMKRRPSDPHFMFTGYDRTHPGALGHAIMAWKFLETQGVPSLVSGVAVNAATLKAEKAENAEVSGIQRTADGLAFSVLARALPFPVPAEALPYLKEFKVEERLNREELAIRGLEDQSYSVKIDGVEVGVWTASELEQGVLLGFNPKTPQYRQAQEVFAAVQTLSKREAVLRGHHSARWFYGQQHAPVDDVKAFADWFEKNVKNKQEYFARFVPKYLTYWPHYREVRSELLADQRQLRKLAKPRIHRYTVTPVAATAAAFSFGKVKVECPHPEGWTIALAREVEPDGGEVARITCTSASAAKPPRFTIAAAFPQVGITDKWMLNTGNCQLGPNWCAPDRSDVAHGMPLAVGFNGNDEAAFSVAASECVRPVALKLAVIEEGSRIACEVTYFDGVSEPLTRYETVIRFNAKRRPFAAAVRSETDWITRTAGIVPCRVPEAAFDPLYSSWYSFHQNVFDHDLEAECALAAKFGMKTLIVDDGWQTDDTKRGYAHCGDWQVSKRRFPDMAAHVKRVQAMGIKYMMWYSVPFVGFKSANYARFKGKYLFDNHRQQASVLDPRFPEVRQFLVDLYVRALKEWNLDGFKLDFIDSFAIHGRDPAVAENYAGRDIRSVPEAVDRLMTDVYAALAAIKPEILIEFRQSYDGPAIRRFGNMIRAGDCPGDMRRNRYAIANLRLACGNAAVHADMLEWNFREAPQCAALNIINSIFGVIQYSVMLREAPEAHRTMIAKWLKFSQDHRETLLHGTFTPHHPELNYPLIEAESAAERIIGVYDDGRLVEIPEDAKPTFLMNATGRDTLTVRRGHSVREVPCASGDWVQL